MSYTFRVWFSGLCHFVENRDPNARCRLCVVLPMAKGQDNRRDHIAGIYGVSRKLDACGNMRIMKGTKILAADDLERHRVVFDMTRADDVPVSSLVTASFSQVGVMFMEDIAGGYADENIEVVSLKPPATVTAQILLESSSVTYDPLLSVLREWHLPATLTDIPTRIPVADPVYVDISNVRRVQLIAQNMDDEHAAPITKELAAVGDVIEIFVTNRCDNEDEDVKDEDVELRWEGKNSLIWMQVDKDFAYNYKMLHPSTSAAIEKLLPKDGKGNPIYPLPESPVAQIWVAPHRCLDVQALLECIPDAIKPGTKPEEEARYKAEAKETRQALLASFRKFSIKGTGTGSGVDCLGSTGRTRFMDLDGVLPPLQQSLTGATMQKLQFQPRQGSGAQQPETLQTEAQSSLRASAAKKR